MAPKCSPNLKEQTDDPAGDPPAKKAKNSPGKGDEEHQAAMIAATKSSAGGSPIPKNTAGVARFFTQVRRARDEDTEDEDDDSDDRDKVKPSPVKRAPPQKELTAAHVEQEDPELYQKIQAVIVASLKDGAGRRKKSNGRHGKSDSFLSVSSGGSATKRRTHRGGRKVREKRETRERREKRPKKASGENGKDRNVDNLICLDISGSTERSSLSGDSSKAESSDSESTQGLKTGGALIDGPFGFLSNAICAKKKANISAAIDIFKAGIKPLLVARIYPRSLSGPPREHYRMPGNKQRMVFADV